MKTFLLIMIPFFGTALGSATVFLFKNKLPAILQKGMLGFASGVMIAASVWSLLIPAIDLSEDMGARKWIPAVVGFLLGMAFLLLLDSLVPHLHLDSDKPEGLQSKASKSAMLFFAVTLHNLPEGMAVGVTFAGAASGQADITFAGALALSAGIALQNIPEGAILSMPLRENGLSKGKAFLYGTLSGIVEPIGAVATLLLAEHVVVILPYLLAFSAGAMLYVVVEELIPESQVGKHSNIGTVGVAVGFALMMVLDVMLE